MIKRIINFILSCFGKSSSSPDKQNDQRYVKKAPNKNGAKLTIIKKEVVLLRIEENLKFIDELVEALEEKGDYRQHIKKLKDMKVQSYGCSKLIKRMSEAAPYYQNTLKAINQHTNTVRELMQLV